MVQIERRRFLVCWIFVDRANHDGKSESRLNTTINKRDRSLLCVVENGSPFVEHVVDAELDATSDYPAQGTIVVVHNIVYEKWIVELQS